MQILNARSLTPRSFVVREDRIHFLDILCSLKSDLAPQKYGHWESLGVPFDCATRDSMAAAWRSGLYVTRAKPKVDVDACSAWGGPATTHGHIAVRAESGKRLVHEAVEFINSVSTAFESDLSLTHVVAEEEYERAKQINTASCYSRSGKIHITLTTHDLRKYIPDLYWGTLFGPPYVKLFGIDRLLSAPAPFVKELHYGAVYIQLSESPYDFVDDYERMESIRELVKNHLGANAFYNPELPRYHKYDVPVFHLDSERYRRMPTEEEFS